MAWSRAVSASVRWASRVPRTAVVLIDQGTISAGTFAFNILLAGAIPLGNYGHYSVILGVLSLMQGSCAALIFYPLSVRSAVADDAGRRRIVVSTLALMLAVGFPLAAVLALVVHSVIDGAPLAPCFALLFASQIQEAARRSLLAEFRYGEAIIGDAISYGGQTVALALMIRLGTMTLAAALWTMSATSMLAAAVQIAQIRPWTERPGSLRALAADFWSIGHWSLTSNVLGILRVQCLPWLLTAFFGAMAAGMFQIAMNLVNVVNPVVFAINSLVPQVASRAGRGGCRAAWAASWPSIAVGLLLVGAGVLMLVSMPQEFLHWVYGRQADAATLDGPIRILAVGALFFYVSSAFCAFLQGLSQGRDTIAAEGAATLIMAIVAPLGILLFGLDGACLALAFAYVVRTASLASFLIARMREAERRPVELAEC